MLRLVFLFAVASVMGACIDGPPPAPTHGALRIHGVPGQGELYVDAISRGPVQPEQLFEGLVAGVHLIDLRRDGLVAASMPVEVRAGMILDARIDAPPLVAAAVNVATPAEPAIEAEAASAPRAAETAANPSLDAPLDTTAAPSVDAAPVAPARPSRSATRDSSAARRVPASARAGSGEGGELDALLVRALERGPSASELEALAEREERAREAEREASAPLPEHLSTSEIASVMQLLRAPIAACGGPPGGTFILDIQVAGATGRPQRVSLRGRLRHSLRATCVQTAVWELRFSRFSRERQSFSWPVQF